MSTKAFFEVSTVLIMNDLNVYINDKAIATRQKRGFIKQVLRFLAFRQPLQANHKLGTFAPQWKARYRISGLNFGRAVPWLFVVLREGLLPGEGHFRCLKRPWRFRLRHSTLSVQGSCIRE